MAGTSCQTCGRKYAALVKAAEAVAELYEPDAEGKPAIRWFAKKEVTKRHRALTKALEKVRD